MTNFRPLYLIVMILLIITNCTTTVSNSKLIYINFGDKKTTSTYPSKIIHYKDRLNIKAKFVELGVIIIEGSIKPNIMEVRELAAEKGADGFIKEGKNYVLIKVLNNNQKKINNQNPQEVIEQNSKEVKKVYEYKKTL